MSISQEVEKEFEPAFVLILKSYFEAFHHHVDFQNQASFCSTAKLLSLSHFMNRNGYVCISF